VRPAAAQRIADDLRVLVAGVGNILFGDDGFGVEVARRLASERLPEGVAVADFGIRGTHLAYELAAGRYHTLILVDATSRGGRPGTIYVLEPQAGRIAAGNADAHGLTPDAMLAWLDRLGALPPRMMLVGCEPASSAEAIGLSDSVAAAVDQALATVRRLAHDATRVTRMS